MLLNDYQQTANNFIKSEIKDEFSYFILGLAGEAGEVANRFKKIMRDEGGVIGNDAALELAHELGDCLWYVSAIASQVLDLDLATIAKWNLVKLTNRHNKPAKDKEDATAGEGVVDSLLRVYDQQATDPSQIEVYKGLKATVAKMVQRGMSK